VSPALLQRQAALAAGALLATLGVLALGERGEPAAPVVPGADVTVRWEKAVVGVLPARAYERETSCGVRLDPDTLGVAHPLLPCGVDLIISAGGKEIRTDVVQRVPVMTDGPEMLLTRALARELGVAGETTIRWRFPG
jgi:hypothetical protein